MKPEASVEGIRLLWSTLNWNAFDAIINFNDADDTEDNVSDCSMEQLKFYYLLFFSFAAFSWFLSFLLIKFGSQKVNVSFVALDTPFRGVIRVISALADDKSQRNVAKKFSLANGLELPRPTLPTRPFNSTSFVEDFAVLRHSPFNLPRKDFRHLLWLFRFMIVFPFCTLHFPGYCSFSSRENSLLVAAAGKAQRAFVVNSFSLSFHSLWQCVYMHFHWKSPEKKRERTFACNFLQLLFVNEWQHQRGRERGGSWRKKGRQNECKQSVNSKEKPRKTEPICSDCPF